MLFWTGTWTQTWRVFWGGQCLQQYSSLSCNKNRLSQQLFLNVNDTFGVLIMQLFSVEIATTEGKKGGKNTYKKLCKAWQGPYSRWYRCVCVGWSKSPTDFYSYSTTETCWIQCHDKTNKQNAAFEKLNNLTIMLLHYLCAFHLT